MNNQHMQNIIKANDDNRLAIFVGAGISKYSETSKIKIPLWQDLIKKIQQDLDEKQEQDYLKLAQLYYLEFGEFSYYQMLKEFFSSNLEPSEIHKLIFQIKPQYVITTNWDDILEKTVSEYNFFYEEVVSDEDLVKSTMQKKLIKMHGDFKHHNIVFKEDDYLNYSHNFPLTENFIKSILSTHTILFIGYSYNDYNLKQITKWIQSFSKIKPPAYLVEFKYNESRAKYLENHGITLLSIDNNNGIDDRFTNMKRFLESIKNKQINEATASVNYSTTIDYFYNQLLPYDNFTVLMPEQIRHCFKNANLRYTSNSMVILDFFGKDKDNINFQEMLKVLDKYAGKNKTEADELFLSQNSSNLKFILESKVKLDKIFTILSKAGFDGVMLDDRSYYKFDLPFYNGVNLDNIITFKLDEAVARDDLEKALIMHELDKNQIAYGVYDTLIKQSMKHQDYHTAFIGMFNSNNLRQILQWDYRIVENKYKDIDDYDLEDKYYDLPKISRATVFYLLDQIKDFKFLYRRAFEVSSLLDDKIKSRQLVSNGGMAFSNEADKPQVEHCNLMYFILGNSIAVEKYNEFLRIMTYFIKIAVIRQFQKDNIQLNKLELYSCISYIKYEDLKDIFSDCAKKEAKQKLMIDKELSNYLLCVLENLENHLLGSQDIPFPSFETYWIKLLYIFSIVKIEDSATLERVLTNFNTILSRSKNSIVIYETVNLFFGLQYQLYEKQIDNNKLVDLLEVLINKIVYKRYNGYEYHAISRDYISNLYSYISLDPDKKYDNEKLVNRLLVELSSWESKQQIEISKSLLIRLYGISNNKIQMEIKDFICKIDIDNIEDEFEKLDTMLFLFANEFAAFEVNNVLEQLDKYVEQFRDGKKMSSQLSNIHSWIDFLVESKKYKQLNKLLKEVKSLIDNFKSPVNSFF